MGATTERTTARRWRRGLISGLVVAAAIGAPSSWNGAIEADDSAPLVDVGREPIIGGTAAPQDKYEFAVALITTQPGFDFQFCGGALISPTWVVTAAHCLKVDADTPEVAADVSAVVDRTDLTNTGVGERIQALRLIPHPGWLGDDGGNDIVNDIALIELASPATTGVPALVAQPGDAALWGPGREGTVMGWGATNPNGTSPSSVLREIDVPFQADSACLLGTDIPALSLCAGGLTGQDSCSGDSGGPLVLPSASDPFTLVGVVSSGPLPCAQAGAEAIYTEVAAFIDWMETNTGLDLTAPTVTINQAASQADPTKGSSAQFDVRFSEPVTGFGVSDVTVTGTAGASVVGVTGSGANYTVTVSDVDQNGTVVVSIPAGAATDAGGYPNQASTSTDNSVARAVFDVEAAASATDRAVRLDLTGG